MTDPRDTVNAFRRALLPAIDRLKRAIFGGYAVSDSTEDEYVATVQTSASDTGSALTDLGFSRSFVSALKIRVDGNVSDGSWVRRDSVLGDKQLHVVLHELDERVAVDLYAHHEYSSITHPVKHYRKADYSAERGVELVRKLLESHPGSLAYDVRPRYRREHRWLLYGVYVVSKSTARRLRRTLDRMYEQFSTALAADGSGNSELLLVNETR